MTKTHEIIKTSIGYTVILKHEDGTTNDYRFKNKTEMNRWLKLAGIN